MKEALVSPDVSVKVVESPVPKPGPGEVLIKVVCSGFNPKDWKIPFFYKVTANSGDDVAGEVAEIGEDVFEFRPGDRVAAFHQMVTRGGSFAEYAIAPASTTFHLPKKTSFEEVRIKMNRWCVSETESVTGVDNSARCFDIGSCALPQPAITIAVGASQVEDSFGHIWWLHSNRAIRHQTRRSFKYTSPHRSRGKEPRRCRTPTRRGSRRRYYRLPKWIRCCCQWNPRSAEAS